MDIVCLITPLLFYIYFTNTYIPLSVVSTHPTESEYLYTYFSVYLLILLQLPTYNRFV